MKRIIVCFLVMVFTNTSFATGLSSDVIYINGEKWALFEKPISNNPSLNYALLRILPKDRVTSTANIDGYTAYWSVKDNWLVLDSIKIELWNEDTNESHDECIPYADLRRVFRAYYQYQYQQGFVATWFSSYLKVGKGKLIYYEHTAWERDAEYEMLLYVDKGKVSIKNSFHNKVAVEGFSLSKFRTREEIKATFPLQIDRYPELKGEEVNKILLSIKDIHVDPFGNLIDCKVTAMVWNQEERKMKESKAISKDVKKMLMNIHPWRTLYIHGVYFPEDRNGWSLTLFLDK